MAALDHLDPRRVRGNDLRIGARTSAVDGTVTDRAGWGPGADEGVPQCMRLARATEVPRRPCAVCTHFRHDRGQERMRIEGLVAVPAAEGGFIQPQEGYVVREMSDVATDPRMIYSPGEYGLCLRWSGRLARRWARRDDRRAQEALTHRFSTCEEWAAVGRF